MANPVDLEFLKLAVQSGDFDRPTAEKCLEILELGARRGQSLSAAQVALNLGLVDDKRADLLLAQISKGTGDADGDGAFALEGFTLHAKLGRGPCGATYEAKKVGEPDVCALKVLTRRFAKHPRILASVLDEARRAAGFEHPNAVPLRAVLQVSGRDVLVQDRVRGRSVAEQLKEGPLPTLRATDIIIEVSRALVAAHARGLFHGDIRPAKVLGEAGMAVRLADFGLAQAACLASGFGQAGLNFGHPEYLAPEVVQERIARPTAQADIYALGVLYYELCCGVVPHHGASPRETLRRHLEAPLPPPPQAVHISRALASVIMRLAAKDPSRRPQDMAAALALVEEYKKARRAGRTSDGEHDPKVPLPIEEEGAISKEDWEKESSRVSSHAEWTTDRIDTAQRVGPAEFTENAKEDTFEPGVLPAVAWRPKDAPAGTHSEVVPVPRKRKRTDTVRERSDRELPIERRGKGLIIVALLVLAAGLGILAFALLSK